MPTGSASSERNRSNVPKDNELTKSQLVGQAMSNRAVNSRKITAAEVASKLFDAITANEVYVFSLPKALGNVKSRMESIAANTNPADPFLELERPEIGEKLRAQFRAL